MTADHTEHAQRRRGVFRQAMTAIASRIRRAIRGPSDAEISAMSTALGGPAYPIPPYPVALPDDLGGPLVDDSAWTDEQEDRAARVHAAFPMDRTGEPLNWPADSTELTVIDLWEVNQRELERRVDAGEPLPEDWTAERVAADRAEHGYGSVVTSQGGEPF